MSDILGVRTAVTWFTATPVTATATEQLVVLAGTRQAVALTPTSTMSVPSGKTFRVERFSAAYIATATSGWAMVRLRVKLGNAVSTTDPVWQQIEVGAPNPTSANSSQGREALLPEGMEIPPLAGFGITVQGFAAATAAATGFVVCEVSGFEYT